MHMVFRLLVMLIPALSAVISAQTTYFWSGGTGDWSVAGNWTPATGPPGVGDTAVVLSGALVTVDADISVDSLAIGGGVLERGTGNTLTVLTGMSWTDGDIAGAGTLEVAVGAGLSITGSAFKDLYDGVFINRGTATWAAASDRISFRDKAVFINAATATFAILGDGFIDYVQLDTGGDFRNFGVLAKVGGAGLATIDPTFYNTGTVACTTGVLRFERGDSTNASTGTFSATDGCTIELSERLFNFDGVDIETTGSGVVNLIDADIFLKSSGMVIDPGSNFALTDAASRISGAGPLTVDGNLLWQAGAIDSTGLLTNTGTITLSTSGTKALYRRTLSNSGTVLWNAGPFALLDSADIVNNADALFDIRTDSRLLPGDATPHAFTNNGRIVKSVATGNTEIEIPFTGSDTVIAASGTIRFEAGSTHLAGSVFQPVGTGVIDLNSGAHSVDSLVVDSTGTVRFSATTMTVNSGGLHVTPVGTLELFFGTVTGSDTIFVDGTLRWRNATLDASGGVILNSGTMNLISTVVTFNNGWDIVNSGTINWDTTSEIRVINGAELRNESGGLLSFNTASVIDARIPGFGTLVNRGTIRKTAAGTTTTDLTLTTSGLLDVDAGTLEFQSSDAAGVKGSVDIASGAMLQLSTNPQTIDSLTVDGSGTFDIHNIAAAIGSDGCVVNSPAILTLTGSSGAISLTGDLTVAGTFTWEQGTVSGAGALSVATLALTTANTKTLDGQTLTLTESATWSAGQFRLTNGAAFVIDAAAAMDITANDTWNEGSGVNTISNAGALRRSGGGATLTVQPDLSNSGTLRVTSGTLAMSGTLTNQASGTIDGTATLDVASAAGFSNAGTVAPGTSAGQLSITGNYPQGATATLAVEIGGPGAGSSYDRLAVSGTATLDGTLDVSILGSYAPSLGDTFVVLTHGGATGNFATVTVPLVGGNPMFSVTYRAGDVLLTTINTETVTANVKLFLQGAWDGGSLTTRINGLLPGSQPYSGAPWSYAGTETVAAFGGTVVDWVLLELRTGTGSETQVARRAALLTSSGVVVDTSGSGAVPFNLTPGNYYVVVRHRNHLPIMSASAVALSDGGPQYDFTTAQAQAFGATAMVQVATGTFALPAGDSDGSGAIDSSDKAAVAAALNQAIYSGADVNFSGLVTYADKKRIIENDGLSSQVPSGAMAAPLARGGRAGNGLRAAQGGGE